MKVQITLADELMERVDSYADDNYMTRSGLISFAVTQFLNQADAVRAINKIGIAISKIADEGKMDEDAKRELEDYARLCKMISLE